MWVWKQLQLLFNFKLGNKHAYSIQFRLKSFGQAINEQSMRLKRFPILNKRWHKNKICSFHVLDLLKNLIYEHIGMCHRPKKSQAIYLIERKQ